MANRMEPRAGSREPHHWRLLTTLKVYLGVTAGVGVALAGTLLLRPIIQPLVYPLFFIAVTLAGWRFGPGAGIYAVVLSVLLAEGVLLQPAEWTVTSQAAARALAVLACALPMVLLAAQHRQALSAKLQAAQVLRESEKMEAVGRLAGGIAHDFNNMLQALQGNADLLMSEPGLPEEARASVLEILNTSTRAAYLTQQLLLFSRRRAQFQPRVLDVARIVRGLHPMLRRLIPENIPLELQLNAHCNVRADPGQLEQVLLNLVVNARDAMPHGGRLLLSVDTVEDPPQYAPGRYCRLTVHDTGGGMDTTTLEHIFEPFFTTKAAGTGLGLATVFAVVQQCGGHLQVESEPGVGSRFEVLLPESHEPLEAEEPAAATVGRPAGSAGRRILVVEDESAVRLVLTRVLRKQGYEVVSAGNGMEGLRVLATELVDLVLTDIVMPEMGGLVFAQYIQDLYPEIPVLFMSGYAANADAQQTAGALQKPVDQQQLVSEIERLLAKAQHASSSTTVSGDATEGSMT